MVAVLPFRVPIEAAGTTSNLLVPLYLVIAGGLRRVRVDGRCASGAAPDARRTRPDRWRSRWRAFLVLYALQALYSKDFDTALEQVVFFLFPFALLFALLREVRWTRERRARAVSACWSRWRSCSARSGSGSTTAASCFWNPKVIAANQFESYFRVNSVFWDPNVYGRFLALVMLGGGGVAAVERAAPRVALGAAAVLAVLWGGSC